jgi:hypothetical protein
MTLKTKQLVLTMTLLSTTILLLACGRAEFTSTQLQQQCATVENGGRVSVSCPNGLNYSFTAPTNGINGVDGVNGVDGMDTQDITVFDPCGDDPSSVDEILLIFPDKSVLAWYKNVGLVVLTPGVTYQTTDNQRCIFKVDSDGNVND